MLRPRSSPPSDSVREKNLLASASWDRRSLKLLLCCSHALGCDSLHGACVSHDPSCVYELGTGWMGGHRTLHYHNNSLYGAFICPRSTRQQKLYQRPVQRKLRLQSTMSGVLNRFLYLVECGVATIASPTGTDSCFLFGFQMPLIPFLPICSIVINTGLMMTLEGWTWLRLVGWVALGEFHSPDSRGDGIIEPIPYTSVSGTFGSLSPGFPSAGMFIYFTYGIRHSKLNKDS